MSNPDETPDSTAEFNAALSSLLPLITRSKLWGWAVIGVTLAATVLVLIFMAPHLQENPRLIWLPIFLEILPIYLTFQHVKNKHVALVMPSVAQTIGLSFDRGGSGFKDGLPQRLLPGTPKTAEDLLQGTVAGRKLRFAEMKVETGGKNSKILFRGFVVHIPNLVAMPPLFVAREKDTKPGFLSGPLVYTEGLVRVGDLKGASGETFGLWSSSQSVLQDPGLPALIKLLTKLDHEFGPDTALYSATSNGEEMHIAISHKRDLFAIGGLFSSEADITSQVRTAFDDMMLPVRIVSATLAAETEVLTLRKEG
jgi:hypothetical protein